MSPARGDRISLPCVRSSFVHLADTNQLLVPLDRRRSGSPRRRCVAARSAPCATRGETPAAPPPESAAAICLLRSAGVNSVATAQAGRDDGWGTAIVGQHGICRAGCAGGRTTSRRTTLRRSAPCPRGTARSRPARRARVGSRAVPRSRRRAVSAASTSLERLTMPGASVDPALDRRQQLPRAAPLLETSAAGVTARAQQDEARDPRRMPAVRLRARPARPSSDR